MTNGPDVIDTKQAEAILRSASANRDYPNLLLHTGEGSVLHEAQRDLLLTLDPLPPLQSLVNASPDLRLFRIRATRRFFMRDLFWRALSDHTTTGRGWRQYRASGRGPGIDPAAGFINPLRLIAPPLLAKNQPLAAAFLTSHWAHVIAVPLKGAFLRPQSLGIWPVGGLDSGLGGPGVGMYTTPDRSIPSRHGEDVLREAASGVNSLLEKLTDPMEWAIDREIDVDERSIAWSTCQHGLRAVASFAEDWSSPESTWMAFRALTMYQGLWDPEGSKPHLSALLSPDTIRKLVVTHLMDSRHQSWTESLVDNYERELVTSSGTVESGVQALCDVRNLVHGTGFYAKDRSRRLRSLRLMDQVNVQFVRDIAALWWTGTLLIPGLRPTDPNPFR